MGSLSSSSNGTANLHAYQPTILQHVESETTHEFATLIVFPSFCPNRIPRIRFLLDVGTREAWSTTERSTRGCMTLRRRWVSPELSNGWVRLHCRVGYLVDLSIDQRRVLTLKWSTYLRCRKSTHLVFWVLLWCCWCLSIGMCDAGYRHELFVISRLSLGADESTLRSCCHVTSTGTHTIQHS